MRTSQWVHRGMGPAGTCEAGPAAYNGWWSSAYSEYMGEGVQLLTVDTWGQEFPSGT